MIKNTQIVLLVVLIVFMAGCGGWRLTGKEFPVEHISKLQSNTTIEEIGLVNANTEHSEKKVPEALSLRGVGVKTLFMVRVFIAGLYLPAQTNSVDALNTEVPKNLSVRFYASFSSKDFVNFTLNNIKPNITRQEFDSLRIEFKRMSEISPNINSGDTLALFYQPGIGTSFIYNGQNKGTIQGELFSKAIYSTWIGPKPFDHIVKRQILGQPRR